MMRPDVVSPSFVPLIGSISRETPFPSMDTADEVIEVLEVATFPSTDITTIGPERENNGASAPSVGEELPRESPPPESESKSSSSSASLPGTDVGGAEEFGVVPVGRNRDETVVVGPLVGNVVGGELVVVELLPEGFSTSETGAAWVVCETVAATLDPAALTATTEIEYVVE